jgi:hypothetical protein
VTVRGLPLTRAAVEEKGRERHQPPKEKGASARETPIAANSQDILLADVSIRQHTSANAQEILLADAADLLNKSG